MPRCLRDRKRILPALFCLNLITHPLATWVFAEGQLGFWSLELCVIAVEALGLSWVTGSRLASMLGVAVLANAATIALSLLL